MVYEGVYIYIYIDLQICRYTEFRDNKRQVVRMVLLFFDLGIHARF